MTKPITLTNHLVDAVVRVGRKAVERHRHEGNDFGHGEHPFRQDGIKRKNQALAGSF